MKNITIGPVDPNWKVAATAHYFAERGGGEEYAFGGTPAEALDNLEKREAAVTREFDEGSAEEVAFLALGAADFFRENPSINLDSYDGYIGFIGEVTRHAPMLSKRWQQMRCGEFGGVWLYDVTQRFGREWAEELINATGVSAAEQLDYIIEDEMEKWR
ncbi:MAG: hypothetical protein WBP11_01225 [Dokdonella sp.]